MRKIIYISTLAFLLSLISCSKEKVDRSKKVQETFEQKRNDYKAIQLENCKEDLFEEISLEVDSIMFFLVQKMNGQSDIMPERPNRPGRLVDTITLEVNPKK